MHCTHYALYPVLTIHRDQLVGFFAESGIGLEELSNGLWPAVEEFLSWCV
jgi:hypothetical protein